MGLIKKTVVHATDAEPEAIDVGDLQHVDPATRRRTVQFLREPGHIPDLLNAIEPEQDRTVRAAIFNALREIGGPEVAQGLAPFLGSENTEIRNASVAVMKSLGRGIDAMMPELLVHEDPDIRIMAIDILQDLGHEAAPQWLGEVLTRDTHANVVGAAIDRLVEIGTTEQCAALEDAAARFKDDPFILFASREAISAIEAGRTP